MPDDQQKSPLARSLEQFANRKVRGAIELLGQSLPASVVSITGSIVTVKFELTGVPFTLPQITIPMIGSEFIRLPIQAGTKGWVMTADAYLGGMSGLGGGTADLTPRPNLSNLVWSPIANSGWTAPDDPNAVVIYGPDGVVLRDMASKSKLVLTASGITITLQSGDQVTINGNVTVNGSGAENGQIINGNLVLNGNLLISGFIQGHTGGTYAGDIATSGEVIAKVGAADIHLSTHTHTQGIDSHNDVEQPTNAPTGGT